MKLQPVPRFRRLLAGFLCSTVLWIGCNGESGDASVDSGGNSDPPGARRATLEQLLRDREATRHPSDGGGSAWIEEPAGPGAEDVQASGPGRWTLVCEAGPLGIAEGGAIRFIVSPFWGWSPPQIETPGLPGYTTVETDAEGVQLELSIPSFLDIRVRSRALGPGARVRIVYGAGDRRAQADRFAESEERFRVAVDGDGDGTHKLLGQSPKVRVAAAPPGLLQLILPGTARPGEPVKLRVVLLDRAGNAGYPFAGTVSLRSVPAWEELPASVEFEPRHHGVRLLELPADAPGVYRVVGGASVPGETGDLALAATSNPLLVEPSGPRILWGDLHGHSALSDGTGTPEDYLRYARDVAGLDVVALTDHDHWGFEPLDESTETWRAIEKEIERFHEPGRFVALLGYEWTNWIHGHRHVLYFEGRGPLLSSLDSRYATPAQLWDGLRGQRALTFAHHSAGGPVPTDWAFPPDPDLEPLTEIVSVHGSSEAADAPSPIYSPLLGNWVRDQLDRGYRFGFVGSGDSHDGHPGLAHLASGKGGMAAILATGHTREEVYAALRSRRTYATNGPRILLRAALGGAPIGAEVEAPAAGQPLTLWVRAIASAPLARIDLIRRGRVEQSVPGAGALEAAPAFELLDLTEGEYVYVRVVQEDGGAAWCTPFFVH